MAEITAQQLTERLTSHQIKPTAMRLLVLRQLMEAEQTLTLRQIEEALTPADRSTIFRTLNLFVQHHVVHVVDDGSGATRYEICHSHHIDGEDDRHPISAAPNVAAPSVSPSNVCHPSPSPKAS